MSQESLWEKRKRRKLGRKTLRRKAKKAAPPGHGIQDRPVILRKVADKTQAAVLQALAELERSRGAEAFRVVFKTIPADKGSEFLDVLGLERSSLGTPHRTRWDSAHPFASWERGSNENGNRMIRRFIPQGSDRSQIDEETIQRTEEWINRYPRKILGFQTAEERYLAEAAAGANFSPSKCGISLYNPPSVPHWGGTAQRDSDTALNRQTMSRQTRLAADGARKPGMSPLVDRHWNRIRT